MKSPKRDLIPAQSIIDQAAIEEAETAYCAALSLHGRNSGEALAAKKYWKRLRWLRRRGIAKGAGFVSTKRSGLP